MRLLVFSDIHDNLEVVQTLRDCEANEYDALVVAGDIGSEIAEAFFDITDSFECPTFYVHGNWDYLQPYSRNTSKYGVLLHGNVEFVAGYAFSGFSGCPTHWGNNPEYEMAVGEVNERYSSTIENLATLRANASASTKAIELEFKNKLDLIISRKLKGGEKSLLKSRERLSQWRYQQLQSLGLPEIKFYESTEYQSYTAAMRECKRNTLARNRSNLISSIRNAGVKDSQVILVTHERLTRLTESNFTPLLHIFGHLHDFKHTVFRGVNFLNAAALDSSEYIFSGEDVLRYPGGYCRVILRDDRVSVSRHRLPAIFLPGRPRA